jgi:hypothetical protein
VYRLAGRPPSRVLGAARAPGPADLDPRAGGPGRRSVSPDGVTSHDRPSHQARGRLRPGEGRGRCWPGVELDAAVAQGRRVGARAVSDRDERQARGFSGFIMMSVWLTGDVRVSE